MVEDQVAQRPQRCRRVVADPPVPVDDERFVADLGETAVRYLLDAAPG